MKKLLLFIFFIAIFKNSYSQSDTGIALNSPPTIYNIVDEMPQYPGGDDKLLAFLNKNIRYTKSARREAIQGKVVVRFVVNQKGEVGDIVVMKSLRKDLDDITIKAISKMPKWIPGKMSGIPVSVYFALPVNFNLH